MSVIQKGQPYLYNGDQVIKFTSAKAVKSIQGYQDKPSMEAWYKEDPTKRHLGLQKFFGDQSGTPTGIFPELLSSKSIIEVNGLQGSFTYDVPMIEDSSVMTTRDYSDQIKPGLDGSPFKIALSREFTTGDILTNDAEFGQQIIVSDEPVEQKGDSFIHVVTLASQDETEYFLASNLAKGITYFKLNHVVFGEYGTNFSHVDMPNTIGQMTCEYTLGDIRGVEAYVTGMADKMSFSGAAASSKEYLRKLEAEAKQMGELAVIMDVNAKGQSLPSTARIGATMQFLVFRELERLTAQALLFQKAATIRSSNGVTRLNEGLWHQLRRGKVIKYSRPGGITKAHIKEAAEYVFKANPMKRYEERQIKFKCGMEALHNVLEIFADEVNAQLNRITSFMGTDRQLPKNPISGSNLHELSLDWIRFTKVYLPQIGNVQLEHDPNLDYMMFQDRFAKGFHSNGRAHTTYSMVIWDAQDSQYSNNTEVPKGAKLVDGGNDQANVFLVKPEGEMMYWGSSYGRYSINKASDIVSSYKQIGQEFWAWNSCSIWVRDITKFVMIELNERARKGYSQ